MNIDLTHPEILTIEQLQNHLIKFVGTDITNDKYELIQLFYKYIAPLPQRTFRDNRLGTILTANQRQFGGEEKRLLPATDSENVKTVTKSKVKLPTNRSTEQTKSEKHESDRGIYTITMQKSANKNTAPIKIKRPVSTTIDSDQEAIKRIKLDDTNT